MVSGERKMGKTLNESFLRDLGLSAFIAILCLAWIKKHVSSINKDGKVNILCDRNKGLQDRLGSHINLTLLF